MLGIWGVRWDLQAWVEEILVAAGPFVVCLLFQM